MKIYAESNFLLEIILSQEESESCKALLDLAICRKIDLRIPAFCFFEAIERVHRLNIADQKSFEDLRSHVKVIKKSVSDPAEIKQLEESLGIFEAVKSLRNQKLKEVASTIEVARILFSPSERFPTIGFELIDELDLKIEDSIVLGEILNDISDNTDEAIFVTKNKKDFQAKEIEDQLRPKKCAVLFSFFDTKGRVDNFLKQEKAT